MYYVFFWRKIEEQKIIAKNRTFLWPLWEAPPLVVKDFQSTFRGVFQTSFSYKTFVGNFFFSTGYFSCNSPGLIHNFVRLSIHAGSPLLVPANSLDVGYFAFEFQYIGFLPPFPSTELQCHSSAPYLRSWPPSPDWVLPSPCHIFTPDHHLGNRSPRQLSGCYLLGSRSGNEKLGKITTATLFLVLQIRSPSTWNTTFSQFHARWVEKFRNHFRLPENPS